MGHPGIPGDDGSPVSTFSTILIDSAALKNTLFNPLSMRAMYLMVNTAISCYEQGERGQPGLNGTQGHQGCPGKRGLKVEHARNIIISCFLLRVGL